MAGWTNWKKFHVSDPKERTRSMRRFYQVYFSIYYLITCKKGQVIIISKNCPSHSGDKPLRNPQHILITQSSIFQVDRSIFSKSSPLQFTQITIFRLTLHRVLVIMSYYPPSINSPHCSPLSPIISSGAQPPSESLSLSSSLFSLPYGASCHYCGSSFSDSVVLFILILQPHCTQHDNNLQKSHFTPLAFPPFT